MEKPIVKLTLDQLERLLTEQKHIVIKQLLSQTGYYNNESDAGHYKTLPINAEKFTMHGLKASYPDDFEVLKKYIC